MDEIDFSPVLVMLRRVFISGIMCSLSLKIGIFIDHRKSIYILKHRNRGCLQESAGIPSPF